MASTNQSESSSEGNNGGALLFSVSPKTPRRNTNAASQEPTRPKSSAASRAPARMTPTPSTDSSSGLIVTATPLDGLEASLGPQAPPPTPMNPLSLDLSAQHPYFAYDPAQFGGSPQFPMFPVAMAPYGSMVPMNGPSYMGNPLQGIPIICQDAQARILALQQAVSRHMGVNSQLQELVGNDLRAIAHLFISAQHVANQAYAQFGEELISAHAEVARLRAELDATRANLARSEAELSDRVRDSTEMETGFSSYLEELKEEMNAMREKITSQSKAIEKALTTNGPGKGPNLGLPSGLPSGPSGFNNKSTYQHEHERRPPRAPKADLEAEAARLRNQIKRKPAPGNWDNAADKNKTGADVERNLSQRLESLSLEKHRSAEFSSAPGPMALQPYLASETPTQGVNRGINTPGAALDRRVSYGPQPLPTPAAAFKFPQAPGGPQMRKPSPVTGPSNALVLRRDDDSENDPETKVWKDMFFKLFSMVGGWAEKYCGEVNEDGTKRIISQHSRLWEYICSITFPKDRRAATNHAMYLLNSKDLRHRFVVRLLLQYIQQNILSFRVWMGFDPAVDKALDEIDNNMRNISGVLYSQRKTFIDMRRNIIGQMVATDCFERFRQYKIGEHAARFKDMTGPLLNNYADRQEASLDLHSISNFALEISLKMVQSRLAFTFVWNECGVKFSQDMHLALNSDTPAAGLQYKHFRVMVVVTPSISYRDDTGVSIIPRGVCKAQVLVMP